MPGLRRFLGDFHVGGKVQIRTNHLNVADGYLRDGLVLIGDAFQMSCPAAGTGISRLITDVDRLCNNHLPRWLAACDASSGQIAGFYADPVKRACDAEAIRIAEYRRAIATDPSLSWRLHRVSVHAYRSLRGWVAYLGQNGQAAPAPLTPPGEAMPISV